MPHHPHSRTGRNGRILALSLLALTLAGKTASAQTFQQAPMPGAPAIITRDLSKPAAIAEKPAPVPDRPVLAADKPLPVQGIAATHSNPNDVAGRYIILREGGKDVGCMLTLDDKARAPGGDLKAQLAPACRDQGIVVFDPVAWRVERGRLVLTARKGHSANFDRQADGAWWKDPSEGGRPLGVKKI